MKRRLQVLRNPLFIIHSFRYRVLSTYLLSAWWHGIFMGYYLTFLTAALFTIGGQGVSIHLQFRKRESKWSSLNLFLIQTCQFLRVLCVIYLIVISNIVRHSSSVALSVGGSSTLLLSNSPMMSSLSSEPRCLNFLHLSSAFLKSSPTLFA